MPGSEALLAPGTSTKVAAVVGDPVEHSLSPALHNAAFRALGLDWVYVAFHVPAGRGAQAIAAVRALGLAGLSVTMPHKADVVGSLDCLSPAAARLGAVNTVVPSAGELIGDNTDAPGFLDALREDDGFDPAGRRCLVLGAGSAARAVTLALAEAGAAEVVVVGRRPGTAERCAMLAGPAGRVGDAREAAGAELLVNATPVGMAPRGALPFDLDPGWLGAGQVVVDLVYEPAVTPLLAAARAAGAATANGLGMLIRQASRQVVLWTGQEPPLGAMSAAALAELARRQRAEREPPDQAPAQPGE